MTVVFLTYSVTYQKNDKEPAKIEQVNESHAAQPRWLDADGHLYCDH